MIRHCKKTGTLLMKKINWPKVNLTRKQTIAGGVAVAAFGIALGFVGTNAFLNDNDSQQRAEVAPNTEPTTFKPLPRPKRIVPRAETLPPQSYRDYTHYVVSDGLNVRFGPSTDFFLATAKPLKRGTCIRVNHTRSDGWASVLLKTKTGQRNFWVSGQPQHIRSIGPSQRCQ